MTATDPGQPGEMRVPDQRGQELTIGSLCTGIGGLDRSVEAYFGATVSWYSEIEPAPCDLLRRLYPEAKNHGDLKLIDWASVEPIDILTAGYPCQPFSHAGNRKGTDDPRHLWPWVLDALRHLRPRLVVLENVQGHLSKGFHVVLGDLAEAGFDAEWCLLRASDVGAPHRRARVFIVATDARRAERWAEGGPRRAPWEHLVPPEWDEGAAPPVGDRSTPRQLSLLPTPVVNDMGANKTPEHWDAWREEMRERHGNGNGHGPSLSIEVQRLALLPTPTAQDASGSRNATSSRQEGSHHHAGTTLNDVAYQGSWGKYEEAIRRWEGLTRPAPPPTILGTNGQQKLAPEFSGWMMGYPARWTEGMTENQALKAFGNAVCAQQALAALYELATPERVGQEARVPAVGRTAS